MTKNSMTLDNFESKSLDNSAVNIQDRLGLLNKEFPSQIKPYEGVYGLTEIDKGNGLTEKTWRNEKGHPVRSYLKDGQLNSTREVVEKGHTIKYFYDDFGTKYCRTETQVANKVVGKSNVELLSNTSIRKGNFSAVTDSLGRPILNKITNLENKVGNRESLNNIIRTDNYKVNDEKGHVIADRLGGPASYENIVPQLDSVNRGKMNAVESLAAKLKNEGHRVDYEVKLNYVGKESRPSSFEPKITVDGKPYLLDKELSKIYNSELKTIEKVKINIGEKVGLAHDLGKKSGAEAAMISGAISTVDNVTAIISGDTTLEDGVVNIAKETGTAAALGYGTGFITTKVASSMAASSQKLISSLGNSGIPSAMISFGIDSFDSVNKFAQGEIESDELFYDLGDSATSAAGAMAGAQVGIAVGTVVGLGLVGTAAGGLVGGMVGYTVSSEAYKSLVELGKDGASELASQAEKFAKGTVDIATKEIPEKAGEIKLAITDFAKEFELPFEL